MATSNVPCSILVEINLPQSDIKAYLVDPFIPLLRDFDCNTFVCVCRPPEKPYIESNRSTDTAIDSIVEFTRVSADKLPLAKHQRRSSGEEKLVTSERADRVGTSDMPKADYCSKNGIQLEATHHADIKPDILSAVQMIREEWIKRSHQEGHSEWWADTKVQRHSSFAQLKLMPRKELEALDLGPQWADLTRRPHPPRLASHSQNRMIECISDSNLTFLNRSLDSSQELISEEHNWQINLPARSGFSLVTVEHFASTVCALNHTIGWDAVVIDPPWENKSAARGSRYRSIELYNLFKINLPRMLGENGGKRALVAIWVTNRPKFRRFLKKKFCPDSHIIGPYAEWYWVKITASPISDDRPILSLGGKPIFDLESRSPRRCYEGVVLGWYIPPSLQSKSNIPILSPKIFLSVPLGHSRKPNLIDLLLPHLPSDPSVLELFARTVSGLKIPGSDTSCVLSANRKGRWHSVGDECLKFIGKPWVEAQSKRHQ